MTLRSLVLTLGFGGWFLITIWAEVRFRQKTKGRNFKRKSFSIKMEHLETEDPLVKQAHRQRNYIIYGCFAVVAGSFLILFPNA